LTKQHFFCLIPHESGKKNVLRISKNSFILVLKEASLFFLVIFSCIFSSLPIVLLQGVSILPSLPLIIFFYLFLFKKLKINYVFIFLCGILCDAFSNFPFGLTSITWLISIRLTRYLQQYLYTSSAFRVMIRDFAILAFLTALIQWILFVILYKRYYSIFGLLFQFSLDMILFSIIEEQLKRLEKILW